MQWKDENSSASEDIEENSYIRVIGSVRLSFGFRYFIIALVVEGFNLGHVGLSLKDHFG